MVKKNILIFQVEKKIKSEENIPEEEKSFNKSQKELNELYELSDMEAESKYSYIFKTLLMSFFLFQYFH